jgi:hypothetical protein
MKNRLKTKQLLFFALLILFPSHVHPFIYHQAFGYKDICVDTTIEPAILVFVSDGGKLGELISEETGGYYSHIALDFIEFDKQGNHLIIEATHNGIQRTKLAYYENRKYTRIPFSLLKINSEKAYDKIKAKLGLGYDYIELASKGRINLPNLFTCAGLANEILEPEILKDIRAKHNAGLINKKSVLIYSESKMFITPNGFFSYYKVLKNN